MLLETDSCRAFLAEELVRRTRANPRYSQRAFARHLGLSPGELSEILRGKRRVSVKTATRLCARLGLAAGESARLIELARRERDDAPEAIREAAATPLTLDAFAIISDWYCLAILSLAETEGFCWNDSWIARRLGITPAEARIARERLLRVGLIEPARKRGEYRVAKDFVFAPGGVPSEAIRNYHRQILSRAARALDTQSVEEREITGITLAVEPAKLRAMKAEISKFLDDLGLRYGAGPRRKEVYQLEIALFRLSEGGN